MCKLQCLGDSGFAGAVGSDQHCETARQTDFEIVFCACAQSSDHELAQVHLWTSSRNDLLLHRAIAMEWCRRLPR
ncbi:hypothetical protein AMK34_31350 [Amycolatopsis sp. CB00013]|nr:hypothetical protein AMK34_31350 [Amycolatopsis sp. CB00013]